MEGRAASDKLSRRRNVTGIEIATRFTEELRDFETQHDEAVVLESRWPSRYDLAVAATRERCVDEAERAIDGLVTEVRQRGGRETIAAPLLLRAKEVVAAGLRAGER